MSREVKADTETRELVSRDTTVKATDRATVIGTASLMAGAIQHVTAGNYSMATQQSQLITVGGNAETDITGSAAIEVGQALTEKIGQLRQSIAGTRQEIIAPFVWIGSEKINVAQLMLDTVALVQQLASHTYPSSASKPAHRPAIAAGFLLPVTRTPQTHDAPCKGAPIARTTINRSSAQRGTGCASARQNNHPADKIGATPHPPAAFAS